MKICEWGWLCNFIPLAWRAYISGLSNAKSAAPKRHSYPRPARLKYLWAWRFGACCAKQCCATPAKIRYACFESYNEFKRAVDACGKFKITEAQNGSSQSLYSGKIVKSPKLWDIFRKIELGVKARKLWQICGKLRRHMLKHNWIPSDNGPGGHRTPDRPRPTVLQLLSGTRTGEKRNLPKKVLSLFWENQNWIFPKSSKILTSEQGAQRAQTEFVFAQTKFVFANFPKNVADFWGNWPQETARALCVRPDRNISSNIIINI